jgi:hypothetical protein
MFELQMMTEKNLKFRSVDQVYSTSFDQNEILQSIIDLHCPEGIELDVCYGNGRFYETINQPKFKFDIDPQIEGVQQANSIDVPLPASSISSMIFDPPFLTYIKGARDHVEGKMAMSKRFGGYYTYAQLEDHYIHSISEGYRLLKKKGVLIVKCQDIIHNHRIHPTHIHVFLWAITEGFKLLDIFILASKSRMPRINRGAQKHARINHSFFMVFRK